MKSMRDAFASTGTRILGDVPTDAESGGVADSQ